MIKTKKIISTSTIQLGLKIKLTVFTVLFCCGLVAHPVLNT